MTIQITIDEQLLDKLLDDVDVHDLHYVELKDIENRDQWVERLQMYLRELPARTVTVTAPNGRVYDLKPSIREVHDLTDDSDCEIELFANVIPVDEPQGHRDVVIALATSARKAAHHASTLVADTPANDDRARTRMLIKWTIAEAATGFKRLLDRFY